MTGADSSSFGSGRVVVLGVFAAEVTHEVDRLPDWGETLPDGASRLLPGGKGSNQAVAASRAGAEAHIITRLGRDEWAMMAIVLWRDVGVSAAVTHHDDAPTGTASTLISRQTGEEATIISPGVAVGMDGNDVNRRVGLLRAANVLMVGLEAPLRAVRRALEVARAAGVTTILDPDPLPDPGVLDDDLLALCDWITPDETEAHALTDLPTRTPQEAMAAAKALRARGVGAVALTMGAAGAVHAGPDGERHVPSPDARARGEVLGAGDAFAGVLAAGIAAGLDPVEVVRRACVGGALAITGGGGARAMPGREGIDAAMAGEGRGAPDEVDDGARNATRDGAGPAAASP